MYSAFTVGIDVLSSEQNMQPLMSSLC